MDNELEDLADCAILIVRCARCDTESEDSTAATRLQAAEEFARAGWAVVNGEAICEVCQ